MEDPSDDRDGRLLLQYPSEEFPAPSPFRRDGAGRLAGDRDRGRPPRRRDGGRDRPVPSQRGRARAPARPQRAMPTPTST